MPGEDATAEEEFEFNRQLVQLYRSNIEYELKRAFGLIEIYRNIFSPSTRGTYTKYNDMFVAAIEQINNMPAGPSPQDPGIIQKYNMPWKSGVIVHCNTFDIDIYNIGYTYCGTGTNVPRDMLDEYIRRGHFKKQNDDYRSLQ